MTDIIIGKKINKPGEYIPFNAYSGARVSMVSDPIGVIYYAGESPEEAARVERFAKKRNARFEWIRGNSYEERKPEVKSTEVKPKEPTKTEEIKPPSFKVTT